MLTLMLLGEMSVITKSSSSSSFSSTCFALLSGGNSNSKISACVRRRTLGVPLGSSSTVLTCSCRLARSSSALLTLVAVTGIFSVSVSGYTTARTALNCMPMSSASAVVVCGVLPVSSISCRRAASAGSGGGVGIVLYARASGAACTETAPPLALASCAKAATSARTSSSDCRRSKPRRETTSSEAKSCRTVPCTKGIDSSYTCGCPSCPSSSTRRCRRLAAVSDSSESSTRTRTVPSAPTVRSYGAGVCSAPRNCANVSLSRTCASLLTSSSRSTVPANSSVCVCNAASCTPPGRPSRARMAARTRVAFANALSTGSPPRSDMFTDSRTVTGYVTLSTPARGTPRFSSTASSVAARSSRE